jgi:hypothetical protein
MVAVASCIAFVGVAEGSGLLSGGGAAVCEAVGSSMGGVQPNNSALAIARSRIVKGIFLRLLMFTIIFLRFEIHIHRVGMAGGNCTIPGHPVAQNLLIYSCIITP